jgi:hypothetical protein
MLTTKDALIAYAKMMNTLDSSQFELLLADDFSFESQAVLTPLVGKKEFIDYIRPKLATVKKANATVYAELGELSAYGQTECVVLAQNDKNHIGAVVYAKVKDGMIVRIDMCTVPDPKTAKRSGIYPK